MEKNYFIKKRITNINCLIIFLVFTAFIGYSQDLTFTINTATTSGSTVSETVIDGTDTYILTASTLKDAVLEDLGTGDMVFYAGQVDTSLTPWTITITKNGTATNFTLTKIDYDTVAEGDISVTNQDDAEIAAQTTYVVGNGSITITNTGNATDIASFDIIPYEGNGLNNFAFHNIEVTIVDPPLSVVDNIFSKHVLIYPNPSNGKILIRNNSDLNFEALKVADINGRILKTVQINNSFPEQDIDLTGLNTGIYFLTITTDKGESTKKLIIN